MKIEKVSNIHMGKAFSVEKVGLALPTGEVKAYERVNHPDSVTILPLDAKGTIWLVSQYRIGSERELLELPAGVIEKGETPLLCAQREIREEIGMAARVWKPLVSLYLAPGYCSEINHIFLAQDLYPAPLRSDEDEFLSIQKFSMTEILKKITGGEIADCKTVAAVGLFFLQDQVNF